MASDVDSPVLGLSWYYAGLALAVLAILLAIAIVVVQGNRNAWPVRVIAIIATACALWTIVTVGRPTHADDARGRASREACVYHPPKRGTAGDIDYGTPCGRALKQQLEISLGPSGGAVVLIVLAGVVTLLRPRRATPVSTRVSETLI